MADVLLQCVLLGRILENPDILNDTESTDFGDFELAEIILGLKNGDLHPLRMWLAKRNVEWHDGRAIDAIHRKSKTQAGSSRVEKVRCRARYLSASTPSDMLAQLMQLAALLEPLS